MDAQIARQFAVLTGSFQTGVRTSSAFDLRSLGGPASLHLPSTYVGGTASFVAATGAAGVYRPVYSNAGVAVAVPAGASRVIHLPDAVVVGPWMKIFAATKQTTTGGVANVAVFAKG